MQTNNGRYKIWICKNEQDRCNKPHPRCLQQLFLDLSDGGRKANRRPTGWLDEAEDSPRLCVLCLRTVSSRYLTNDTTRTQFRFDSLVRVYSVIENGTKPLALDEDLELPC